MIPKLIYFDIAFWKGEVPRILFSMSGKEFEDVRLDKPKFDEMNEKGELPFGQVPVLVEGDKKLTQGCAIMRYLAKDAGVMPTDPFEVAKVDEVLHLLEEFQVYIGSTMSYRIPDETKRLAARKVLADETIPKFFARFETLLDGKEYLVGGKFSLADICVWKIIHWLTCGQLDGIPTDCTQNFPDLCKNYEAVASNEKVKAWTTKYPEVYK